MVYYKISPTTKPRQTQRDKWLNPPRPCVSKYRAFKDEVEFLKIELPEHYHVVFMMPMPRYWNEGKKEKMVLQPHKQTPDLDNLFKALGDSLYGNDSHIWDGRCTKIWAYFPGIIIEEIESPDIVGIVTKYYK